MNKPLHTNTTAQAEALEVHARNTTTYTWKTPTGEVAFRNGRSFSACVIFDGELYALANLEGDVMQWTTKKVVGQIIAGGFDIDATWIKLYSDFRATAPVAA